MKGKGTMKGKCDRRNGFLVGIALYLCTLLAAYGVGKLDIHSYIYPSLGIYLSFWHRVFLDTSFVLALICLWMVIRLFWRKKIPQGALALGVLLLIGAIGYPKALSAAEQTSVTVHEPELIGKTKNTIIIKGVSNVEITLYCTESESELIDLNGDYDAIAYRYFDDDTEGILENIYPGNESS